MTDFFRLFFSFWEALLNKLNSISFELGGYNVTLFGVLLAFFMIGLVITIFWGGSKT